MVSKNLKSKFCLPTVERSLLCLAINEPNCYYDIVAKISEQDFLDESNSCLFIVLKSLSSRGIQKFDVVAILDEAKRLDLEDTIGGLKYVRAITNMDIDPSNIQVYIKQLLNASTRLKLFSSLDRQSSNILTSAENNDDDIEGLISKVEYDIISISGDSKAIEEPINLSDGLEAFIEEKMDNKVIITGLSTGFPILDKMIDGLIPGTLFIVAARMKEGKSALLTQMALNLGIVQKVPLLYVDTELTFNEWRTRALASVSQVPERAIKHGNLDDAQYARVKKGIQNIKKAKIFHQYMPGYSVDKLVTLFTKYKLKEDIGVAIFDYLKEPDSTSIDRNRKEYQILGDVTTKLKDLGGKLNIPVLSAVQLNRSNEVADSDRVARYGDIVTMWSKIYKDDAEEKKAIESGTYKKDTHKLVVRTTRRGGSTGEEGIHYQFTKRILGIKELEPHMQPKDFDKWLREEQDEFRPQQQNKSFIGHDDLPLE